MHALKETDNKCKSRCLFLNSDEITVNLMFSKSPASSKEAFVIKWKPSRPKGHGNGYSNGQPCDHGIVMATPMLTAMDNRIARAMDSPMDN